MIKYKRLTDKQLAEKYRNHYYGDSTKLWDAYVRLAELEDKIENGTLIELPCMQICSKREVVQVIYKDPFFGICIDQFSKAHQSRAEARLNELKGECV